MSAQCTDMQMTSICKTLTVGLQHFSDLFALEVSDRPVHFSISFISSPFVYFFFFSLSLPRPFALYDLQFTSDVHSSIFYEKL